MHGSAPSGEDTFGHRRAGEARSARARGGIDGRFGEERFQSGAPAGEIEGGAERARDTLHGLRVDADGRGEDGDLAGQRLEHSEPEALPLGWHDHGVGGGYPERHACGLDAAEREQPGANGP